MGSCGGGVGSLGGGVGSLRGGVGSRGGDGSGAAAGGGLTTRFGGLDGGGLVCSAAFSSKADILLLTPVGATAGLCCLSLCSLCLSASTSLSRCFSRACWRPERLTGKSNHECTYTWWLLPLQLLAPPSHV